MCDGGGGKDAPIWRERGASEIAPPGDHPDSILFPRKLRGGRGTGRRAGFLGRERSKNVRLEHRRLSW